MNGPVLLTCLIKRGGGGWLHSDDDNYEMPHRHKLFLEMLCSSGRYTVKLDEVECPLECSSTCQLSSGLTLTDFSFEAAPTPTQAENIIINSQFALVSVN